MARVFVNDSAPAYLRDLLGELAEPSEAERPHEHLRPGAPRWMVDKAEELEAKGGQIHKECLERYRKKPAQWLMSLDGFTDKCLLEDKTKDEPEPDYWLTRDYELAVAGWNARLTVTPETSRQEAITLAKGFVKWLKKMTDDDFASYMRPKVEGLLTAEPPPEPDFVDANGNPLPF